MNEEPARAAHQKNEKEYFLFKKIRTILEIIIILVVLYFVFTVQLKTGILVALFSVTIISFAEFLISIRTGILNKRTVITLLANKSTDIYKQKEPEKFATYQRSQVFLSVFALVLIYWAYFN